MAETVTLIVPKHLVTAEMQEYIDEGHIRRGREYPDEMTDDITWILGRPNFACAPIAHALRTAGDMRIETRGEAEQAHVIHWLLKMALDHPEDWRKRVGDRLDAIAKAAKA